MTKLSSLTFVAALLALAPGCFDQSPGSANTPPPALDAAEDANDYDLSACEELAEEASICWEDAEGDEAMEADCLHMDDMVETCMDDVWQNHDEDHDQDDDRDADELWQVCEELALEAEACWENADGNERHEERCLDLDWQVHDCVDEAIALEDEQDYDYDHDADQDGPGLEVCEELAQVAEACWGVSQGDEGIEAACLLLDHEVEQCFDEAWAAEACEH